MDIFFCYIITTSLLTSPFPSSSCSCHHARAKSTIVSIKSRHANYQPLYPSIVRHVHAPSSSISSKSLILCIKAQNTALISIVAILLNVRKDPRMLRLIRFALLFWWFFAKLPKTAVYDIRGLIGLEFYESQLNITWLCD